jgi:hypothetical protein
MHVRIYIFILWILSNVCYSQTFDYSYTDPCTGSKKTIQVPSNGITVTYYGQIHSFQPADFSNGTFDSWAGSIYNQFGNNNPCSALVGLPTEVSIAQDSAITLISIINSLSAISDITLDIAEKATLETSGSTNMLSAIGSLQESKTTEKRKSDKQISNESSNSETQVNTGSTAIYSNPNGLNVQTTEVSNTSVLQTSTNITSGQVSTDGSNGPVSTDSSNGSAFSNVPNGSHPTNGLNIQNSSTASNNSNGLTSPNGSNGSISPDGSNGPVPTNDSNGSISFNGSNGPQPINVLNIQDSSMTPNGSNHQISINGNNNTPGSNNTASGSVSNNHNNTDGLSSSNSLSNADGPNGSLSTNHSNDNNTSGSTDIGNQTNNNSSNIPETSTEATTIIPSGSVNYNGQAPSNGTGANNTVSSNVYNGSATSNQSISSNGSVNYNGQESSNSTGGNTQSNIDTNTQNNGTSTTQEDKPATNIIGGSISSLGNVAASKSSSAASKNGNRPTILASSDFVGFNFKKSDTSYGGKFTGGFTSTRWDGLRSSGLMADYTTALKGPNITGFYAFIGDKKTDLISTTLTFGFDAKTSYYGTIALGEMRSFKKIKNFKIVYMISGSFGKVYGESFIGTAAIAGGMYDMKVSKRYQMKMLLLYVYCPYVSYYNDILLKSPQVVLPIVGTNIGLTKRFKININIGGAFDLKNSAMNYTVMMGTRLLL